jgi:hypothetical protein
MACLTYVQVHDVGLVHDLCARSVVRASPPPHHQTPLFIKSCTRIAQILLPSSIDGPFCSGHFNPFKSFFLLWIWTVSSTRPDVRT